MPKSRPATWLEKEMMLNLIKKSGKKLDVDLDKCDYIRSSAGNLVCMFEDQPVFYVTKGCRLAMPPRPKKIKTSLRNKNLKKLAKKDAKKKAAHEKQVEKQREKMAQIAEQGKEEIDRSIFETVQDREKRMRWVKVIDEEAEKVNCGEMKFDIFPVFEDSLGSVRMRIVVQPKMDKKIGEIMPKQIPPQNWSDDMVRERIERVTQSDAFEIRLNKDVEYNLRLRVFGEALNADDYGMDSSFLTIKDGKLDIYAASEYGQSTDIPGFEMAFEDGKYVIAMDEDFANKLKDPEEEAIGDSLLDTDELESKIKELTAGNNSKLELQLTEDGQLAVTCAVDVQNDYLTFSTKAIQVLADKSSEEDLDAAKKAAEEADASDDVEATTEAEDADADADAESLGDVSIADEDAENVDVDVTADAD